MSQEIIEKIKQAIEGYREDSKWEEIGTVTEAGDGIVKISGLKNVQSQEVLVIETSDKRQETRAVALNLEEDSVGALVLGNSELVKSGDTVKRTKKLLSIPVGENLLGRVVNPLGNALDGKGLIFSEKSKSQFNALEANAPDVLARESVNQPLHTGIKAIDSMIPIGRGQRELIIGDRQTGKTAIALDMIINQSAGWQARKNGGSSALAESEAASSETNAESRGNNSVVCIYVAIGQ
ncbi:MAG: hypothetical protein AAB877_02555, partial [Patescibacteria group bacterium]